MMGDPNHTNNMAGYYLEGATPKPSAWRNALGAILFVAVLVIIESLAWYWGLNK